MQRKSLHEYSIFYTVLIFFLFLGGISQSIETYPSNDLRFHLPPKRIANQGLILTKGDRAIISSSALEYSDPEGTTITYTLQSFPGFGSLVLDETTLTKYNKTFTQPDIDAGLLSYKHEFGNLAHEFEFTVSDADGITTGPDTFLIQILPFTPSERVYVDQNAPGPIHDGTSWERAIPSMRHGVLDATILELPEVWVADGGYPESVLLYDFSNIGVYGGFEGYGGAEETLRDQRNWKDNLTFIKPPESQPGFIVESVSDFTLDGFTITGAYLSREKTNGGAGLICILASGKNTIANCTIKNNRTQASVDSDTIGGGILIGYSSISFENCTISDNLSSGSISSKGADINARKAMGGGGYFLSSSLCFNDCKITSNSAIAGDVKGDTSQGKDALGGGLYFYSCHVSLNNTLISHNKALGGDDQGNYANGGDAKGGGIYFTSGTLQMTGCDFSANIAKGGDAVGLISASGGWAYSGGLYCEGLQDILTNCLFDGNICMCGDALLAPGSDQSIYSASAFGGGATLQTYSSIVQNCRFVSNQSIGGKTLFQGDVTISREGGLGGGGLILSSMQSTIRNSLISGNRTLRRGHPDSNRSMGGAMVCEIYGESKIINCIISGNSSTDYTGAIYYFYSDKNTSITLQNCTVSGNSSNGWGGIATSLGSYFLNNCIFENNENHAIYELIEHSDPVVSHCLFYNNPNGDYYDFDSIPHTITGANEINMLPNASGNVEGDPLFVMNSPGGIIGTWTQVKFDPLKNQTILTDSTGNFTPGKFSGCMILPNSKRRIQSFVIDNTTNSFIVWGDQTAIAQIGTQYKIVDYRLYSVDSPALDQGSKQGAPPHDFEGRPRPYDFPGIGYDGTGEGFDIGAFEFRMIYDGFLVY